jgi:hypothetical protein
MTPAGRGPERRADREGRAPLARRAASTTTDGGNHMTDTQEATEYNAVPHDPAMAAPDPAMFASLTDDENKILGAHLTSGWHKQSVVYPVLSEPWRETSTLLKDLNGAYWAARAGHPQAGHGEPEAGS